MARRKKKGGKAAGTAKVKRGFSKSVAGFQAAQTHNLPGLDTSYPAKGLGGRKRGKGAPAMKLGKGKVSRRKKKVVMA
jgi:hypothetical protein